ncbi:MAG: fused MFS/spermidine synthase [Patescibacteria group bacterium]
MRTPANSFLMRVSRLLHEVQENPQFSISIFLGAFLLFQIQPMIGRYLLPHFGGSTSTWTTSLVFFTTALFAGYLYAYGMGKLPARARSTVHITLASACGVLIAWTLITTGSAYAPLSGIAESGLAPALTVLLTLIVSIGAPYVLLATTSPLLQQWYVEATGREPYHLYALSNLGSFLALISYPFLFEPALELSAQQVLWVGLFFAYLGCIVFTFRRAPAKEVQGTPGAVRDGSAAPGFYRHAAWLGLAMLPAAMLVATTVHLTQTIAPIPFLWVLPLALYLLSFILAFRGRGGGAWVAFVTVLAAVASYVLAGYDISDVSREMLANLVLFFFGSLYCHALLYRERPPKESAALYYVWISLGGALGTLAMSVLAPLVFVNFTEFLLGAALFASVAIVCFPVAQHIGNEYRKYAVATKVAVLVIVAASFLQAYALSENVEAVHASRNFYGAVAVYERDGVRFLYHGTTLHGSQYTDPARELVPREYYSKESGIGRALVSVRAERGLEPMSIGVIGLGSGTLAAYCEKNDRFVFYEIDERIERVAREYFTYVAHCPQAEVRLGDARVRLEAELGRNMPGMFDVLVIDAFSDDTVPVHLLTREAFELYLAHVRSPESILAVHVSNRYLDLGSVVLRLAKALGMASATILGTGEEGRARVKWILLAENPKALASATIKSGARELPSVRDVRPWTDDYANVFSVLNLPTLVWWEQPNQ